ncbi:DUF4190 domain-containing protein [Micromonospora chersina]|uniref:DUF4190 domain-containing protein n=1 Tax=Micromonospora chersina TaxID=47854 RepID=UPI00371DFB6B
MPVSPVPYGQPQHVVVAVNTDKQTSTFAVLSLVFSLLGVVGACCTFGVFSLVAVTLGHLALPETTKGGKSGHGMAITGLVLGYLMLIPAIFFSISMVLGAGTP